MEKFSTYHTSDGIDGEMGNGEVGKRFLKFHLSPSWVGWGRRLWRFLRGASKVHMRQSRHRHGFYLQSAHLASGPSRQILGVRRHHGEMGKWGSGVRNEKTLDRQAGVGGIFCIGACAGAADAIFYEWLGRTHFVGAIMQSASCDRNLLSRIESNFGRKSVSLAEGAGVAFFANIADNIKPKFSKIYELKCGG